MRQLTEQKTRNVKIEEQLQRKEETIDDLKEAQEAELKVRSIKIVDLEEELSIYKRRLSESHQKMRQAGQKQSNDNRQIESEMRRRENEWNDAKLKMERTMQTIQLRKQQCVEFIDLIRKEEKNIVPQIDAKIKHYFSAAFQNLTAQQ